jgi:hypothetical protein
VNYHPLVKTATRIGQLLRLALSTDRDGECIAAIQATRRALAAAGLDHHAVADAVMTALGKPVVPLPELDWRDTARFCQGHGELLSEREAAFVINILRRAGRSAKSKINGSKTSRHD